MPTIATTSVFMVRVKSVYKGRSESEMPQRRVLSVLFVITAASCTRPPDYLYVDPRAQPLRLELRKAFGNLSPQYGPVPISECVFHEAAPPGAPDTDPHPQEIWRVISVAPDRPVIELRYGVLPPGFLQAAPQSGPPPPLLPGHHYTAECSGDAVGSSEFVIPEVAPRPVPTPARAGDATRRRDDRRTRGSRP
jgi:hypothetical protein